MAKKLTEEEEYIKLLETLISGYKPNEMMPVSGSLIYDLQAYFIGKQKEKNYEDKNNV